MDIPELPTEMIEKICENLDNPTLLRTSEASFEMYRTCQRLIRERREAYEAMKKREKDITEIEEKLWKYINLSGLHAIRGNITVSIGATSYLTIGHRNVVNKISIQQLGPGLNNIPWILAPNRNFRTGTINNVPVRTTIIDAKDTDSIKTLARNIYEHGYTLTNTYGELI